MKNDFYIEVKTKWKKEDNKFSRDVIEYACNNDKDYQELEFYTKDLDPINCYKETSSNISSNTLEICAKNKATKEIIQNPNGLINVLLAYTKQQWLNEE